MNEVDQQEPEMRDPFAPVPGAEKEWVEVDERTGATYAMAQFPDGRVTTQLLPLPANMDSIRSTVKVEEGKIQVDMKVFRDISRRLIHAYVHTLSEDKANDYLHAYNDFKKGVNLEKFSQVQTDTISYLNSAHAKGSSAYDERELLSKSIVFASIQDETKRKDTVNDYIYPLVGEIEE